MRVQRLNIIGERCDWAKGAKRSKTDKTQQDHEAGRCPTRDLSRLRLILPGCLSVCPRRPGICCADGRLQAQYWAVPHARAIMGNDQTSPKRQRRQERWDDKSIRLRELFFQFFASLQGAQISPKSGALATISGY
jgi:hypothetical protein